MRLTANDLKQFIFGISDGLTSALGVVIPLALAHQSMLAVISGLAIAAAIGMGSGEWLSDHTGNLRSAIAMALASFVGTVIPAIPFFVLPYGISSVVSGALCVGTGVAISETKARDIPRRTAYLQTFSVLLIASTACIGFALLTGTAG